MYYFKAVIGSIVLSSIIFGVGALVERRTGLQFEEMLPGVFLAALIGLGFLIWLL